MTEGRIDIYLSYKEPEYRDNIMWLRPYIDKEGFELLYYGVNGWTVFVPCNNVVVSGNWEETVSKPSYDSDKNDEELDFNTDEPFTDLNSGSTENNPCKCIE